MPPLHISLHSLRFPKIPKRGLCTIHTEPTINSQYALNHSPPHPNLLPSRRRSITSISRISRTYSTTHGPSGLLTGKKALITGSSRGIGKAIAERFAAEGALCVLIGRDEGTLSEVRNRLPTFKAQNEAGSSEIKHVIRVGDVGDGAFWKRLRDEKPIDILVNAAGITHSSPLFVTTEELLEKIVSTNLMGTMLGCKVIGRTMMGNGDGGCIINVASLLGLKGDMPLCLRKPKAHEYRFHTSAGRRSGQIQCPRECHSTRLHRDRHDSWYVFLSILIICSHRGRVLHLCTRPYHF
jgi:hypothetical protein